MTPFWHLEHVIAIFSLNHFYNILTTYKPYLTELNTHLRMSLSKSANFDQAQSVIPCDVCEAESGDHYCTVCRQTLCDGCKKYHKKVAATKDHDVLPRVQMASAVESTTCSRHPNQTVSLQCESCQILVCIKCVAGEHRRHPMVELSKIYQDEKEKVEKDIREIEQRTIPRLIKAIENIKPKREEYKKTIAGIRTEMDNETKEIKSRLDKIHAERLKKLAEVEATGMKQFDQSQQELEERKRSYTDDVATCKAKITSDNQVQFVSYARTRGTNVHFHKYPALKFSRPPVQTVKTDKKDISEFLAKLNITTTPSCTITYRQIVDPQIVSTFKSKSKGWPSICLTEDGKAWVGGDESKELRLVDRNGKIASTRKSKNRPRSLAMMPSGDIILCPISDNSKAVMKLRADGTECPLLDVSPSYSEGVSLTEVGDILVCTTDGRVMRINGDGGNVHQIYDGKKNYSAIHAIELPDSNICISDVAHNALVIIDKNGKILRQINKPLGVQDFSPCGLACDNIGNILSADKNGCLYIISQKGEIRELVGKSHGIKEAMWLGLDSEDSLWVAQNDGYIKVVKYLA